MLVLAPRSAPPPPCRAAARGRPGALATDALARQSVEELLASCAQTGCPVRLPAASGVETLVVMPGAPPEVEVRLSPEVGALVWREGEVLAFEARLAEAVHEAIPDAVVRAFVSGPGEPVPLAALAVEAPVPPASLPAGAAPLVRRLDAPHAPEAGLQGRHLALWPSHGWYYEASLDRWEWQRARVFTTVEDLLPFAFVQRYLAPMLERAGANVLMPRERDPQPNQAVVDNDGGDDGRYAERGRWRRGGDGFAHRPPYRDTTNPFELGTYRQARASGEADAEIVWAPEIPESGDYAVYVSYHHDPANVEDARYTVHHEGGATRFAVNQTMGGGTWIYLGTFAFARGSDAQNASVTLSNASATPGRTVTADAVRFGGGMGEVERGGHTSERPRFVEGARYYEQFAGFPARSVYAVSQEDDYKDDYQSRGEWVNYLRGAPYGPTDDRDARGLGIPVDLSLAFHTDAGRTDDGTVVGTLLIYNTIGMDSTGVFPDGRSRRVNRTLAEAAHDEIVDDLRANWKPDWTFRDYWNKGYSEATRPNVPSLLLELLSHHNPTDMRYALDPRFRRDASRAIYKAIGRFLAEQDGRAFVPQPLAPTHLVATLDGYGGARELAAPARPAGASGGARPLRDLPAPRRGRMERRHPRRRHRDHRPRARGRRGPQRPRGGGQRGRRERVERGARRRRRARRRHAGARRERLRPDRAAAVRLGGRLDRLRPQAGRGRRRWPRREHHRRPVRVRHDRALDRRRPARTRRL